MMTDKQMEEKKKEFMENFVDIEFGEYDQGLILGKEEVEEMWQWISKLVEEVEKECEKKSFENFKKRLMLDLEKKLTN